MLREAFEFLFSKGANSVPDVVKVPGEPDHVYFVRQPDGTLARKFADPPPAKHTAGSLDTLVAFATTHDEWRQRRVAPAPQQSAIPDWVSAGLDSVYARRPQAPIEAAPDAGGERTPARGDAGGPT